jgi:hypothetical protein
MTSSAALHAVAARLLGPCTVTGVLSPAVVRITTESGDELVVKQHATRSKHEREVHACHRADPARQRGRPYHQVKMAAGAPEMTSFYRAKL